MKLNFCSVKGPDTQGELPHSDADASGEPTGTNRCRLGIANVCPTAQCAQPLRVGVTCTGPIGLLVSLNCWKAMTPPLVPWTWLQ